MTNDIGGVWRTIGGRRVFIKDGEDLATAMKNSGKFNSNKTNYDYDKDGKLTRTSFQKYLSTISKKIKDDREPNYDNILLNMRMLGFGMKDIRKLEFNETESTYSIMGTFYTGLSFEIWYKTKY